MDWSDIFKPVVNLAGNLFDSYNQDRSGDALSKVLRGREDSDYTNTLAYNDALGKYNAQAMAMAGRRGGGGGGRAAAAAATEANRQKALARANRRLMKTYDQSMAMYKPFADTATQLLPKMQQTYTQGLDTSGLLNAYLQKPENMSLLNASKSATAAGPQLPDYMRRG